MEYLSNWFSRFSQYVDAWTGSPVAFGLAVLTILIWAAFGPVFEWSDTHQLIINTFTTVITYLMVFCLQSAQNRNSAAMHIKLDELIRATDAARNRIILAEDADRQELDMLRDELHREAKE
jgi:low affinity Fe/Cu permease